MKKNNNLMSGKGEKGKWITVNGSHVFIEDGQSVDDAVDRHFTKEQNREFAENNEIKTKKIHLQGLPDRNAVEASNLKVGDEMIWNFGYKEKVLDITPSKSGQTLTVKIKDMQSGNELTRTLRANSYVALTRLN